MAKVDHATELRRRQLYDQGLSDVEIAKEAAVPRETIRSWRLARQLPANVQQGCPKVRSDEWWSNFFASQPRISDRALAKIAVVEPKAVWRARRRLSIAAWERPSARRLGAPRRILGKVEILSIDLACGELGNLNLHDRIADPRWSNWLEEAGASVW